MIDSANNVFVLPPYYGGITREQFLFYETRTTAKLLTSGLNDDEIIDRILTENLFQYPTERVVQSIAKGCLKRLHAMSDDNLVRAMAEEPSENAKQICLYAMMRYNRIVWDFMVTVIGEKYRQQNMSFSKLDLNVFFMQLQEQNESVASWTDKTIGKIKQVLVKTLVENGYLDNTKSTVLNPVLICSTLENVLRERNETAALAAFNCFC